MGMSLEEFSTIIGEASVASPTRERLEQVFQDAKTAHKELTLKRLAEQASPIKPEKLALLMTALVNRGLVERVIRVESPSGEGVRDFKSVEEVPKELKDWRTQQTFHVRPENIVVVYKF